MFKISSFFAGVGGLDYGAHISPDFYEFVFINDFNKEACQTYRLNWGSTIPLKEGDIKALLDTVPEHDILIGGFPCQPYSLAGLRKGLEDERGLEVYSLSKTLDRVKPSYFIFENVKGLLSHDKGKTLETILKLFSDLGYKIHYELIKMVDYGVPQMRERVIFFGVRSDIDLNPKLMVPPKQGTKVRLSEALESVKYTLGENNHNLHVSTGVKQHWMAILKEGENLSKLSEEEIMNRELDLGVPHRKKPKSLTGYRRLDGSKVSPTMMFGNTCLPIHPKENRNLSVRECATIQSFPQDFKFAGGIVAQYKQIGNAVPPKFSVILFNHLKTVLTKGQKSEQTVYASELYK